MWSFFSCQLMHSFTLRWEASNLQLVCRAACGCGNNAALEVCCVVCQDIFNFAAAFRKIRLLVSSFASSPVSLWFEILLTCLGTVHCFLYIRPTHFSKIRASPLLALLALLAAKLFQACSKNVMIYLLPLTMGIFVTISFHLFHSLLSLGFNTHVLSQMIFLAVFGCCGFCFCFILRIVSSWTNINQIMQSNTTSCSVLVLMLSQYSFPAESDIDSASGVLFLVCCFWAPGSGADSSADWSHALLLLCSVTKSICCIWTILQLLFSPWYVLF